MMPIDKDAAHEQRYETNWVSFRMDAQSNPRVRST